MVAHLKAERLDEGSLLEPWSEVTLVAENLNSLVFNPDHYLELYSSFPKPHTMIRTKKPPSLPSGKEGNKAISASSMQAKQE